MVETKPKQPPTNPPPASPTPPPLSLPHEGGFDFVAFLVTAFVVTLLVTAGAFGFRYLVLARTLDEQQRQIASLERELATPELAELDRQIQEIANGIAVIRPVLEDKTRYAELFWMLRKDTEKGVRWTSLGFTEAKQLSLTGQAVGWGQVARQVARFKGSDKLSQVELLSANLEETERGVRVQFSLTAQVDPTKLVPPEQ